VFLSKVSAIVLMICALSLQESRGKEAAPLKIQVDPSTTAPYLFSGEFRNQRSITTDYINRLSGELKITIEAHNAKGQERPDFVLTSNTENTGLKNRVSTISFMKTPVVVALHENSPFLRDTSELKGKKIALKSKTYGRKIGISDSDIIIYKNYKDALIDLSNRRVYAVIGNITSIIHFIKSGNHRNIKIGGNTGFFKEFRIYTPPENKNIIKVLNSGILRLKENAENEILSTWLSVNFNSFSTGPIHLIMLLIFIVLIFALWNLKLSKLNKLLNREIEDKNYAASKLNQAHMMLNNIVEFLPDPTMVVDKKLNIIAWNRNMENLTGISKESILDRNLIENIDSIHCIKEPAIIERMLHDESDYEKYGYSSVKKQGNVVSAEAEIDSPACPELKHIWIASSLLRDSSGETSGGISCIRDLTDIKTKENRLHDLISQLKEANQKINEEISMKEESERRFRELSDLLPQMVFEMDMDGFLTYTNNYGLELTGCTEDNYVKKNFFDFFSKQDRDKAKCDIYNNIRNKRFLPNEYEFIISDNLIIPVIFYATLIEKNGAISGMRGIIIDISERKKDEEAIKSANRAKSAFLANMSHEIRTPMNAIIGLSEIILNERINKVVRNYVTKIYSSAQSLLGIINDILDYSKIEAGKLTIEKIDFNIMDIFQSVSDLLSHSAAEKNIILSFHITPNVPENLNGDPLRIRQILVNLLSNAIKFTENGMVTLNADYNRTAAHKNCGYLNVSVKDTGIGMTSKQVNKLFKSFSQVDSSTSRRFGGTGLGLAITRDLIEKMGGTISVSSDPGRGSEFSFQIKLKEVSPCITKENIHAKRTKIKDLIIVDKNNDLSASLDTSQEKEYENIEVLSSLSKLYRVLETANQKESCILIDEKVISKRTEEKIRKIEFYTDRAVPVILAVSPEKIVFYQGMISGNRSIRLAAKPVSMAKLLKTYLDLNSPENQSESNSNTDPLKKGLLPLSNARILIVEDNRINQLVITGLLKNTGVVTTIANSGQECLKLIDKHNFDLVLMDIQMPLIDGYTTTRILRGYHKELPIIGLTAHALMGERQRCLDAGMNDYISKPIDADELKSKISHWVSIKSDTVTSIPEDMGKQIELPDRIGNINIESSVKMLDKNSTLYASIITGFHESGHEELFNILELIKAKKEDEAAQRLHTLKGLSGTIGAFSLQKISQELEKNIKSETYENRPELIKQFREEMVDCLDTIEKNLHIFKVDRVPQRTKTECDTPSRIINEIVYFIDEDQAQVIPKLRELLSFFPDKTTEINRIISHGENFEFEEVRELILEFAEMQNPAAEEE